MRRPLGVVIAAILLGLVAAFGLLTTIILTITLLLFRGPGTPPPLAVGAFLAGFNLLAIGYLGLCTWTVVDLFRMRMWARYSVIAIAALQGALLGVLSVSMLLLRRFVPHASATTVNHLPYNTGGPLIGAALLYAVMAGLCLWWVVYFNRAPVRLAFEESRRARAVGTSTRASFADGYGPWQVVVMVMACLMVAGGVGILATLPMHMPLFVFGIVLRGNAAMGARVVFGALAMLVGIGLLRRMRIAYWLALAWQCIGLASALLMMYPRYRVRMLGEFQTQAHTAIPQSFVVVGSLFGIANVLLFAYALLRSRGMFAPVSYAPDQLAP